MDNDEPDEKTGATIIFAVCFAGIVLGLVTVFVFQAISWVLK